MAKTTTGAIAPTTDQQTRHNIPTPRAGQPYPGAQLVPTRGPGARAAVVADTTTIGRDRHCDLVLDDPTISRHHANLHQHERYRYTLSDTGTLNGVYLNRQPTQHADLADGDEIWIGRARFTFHLVID